MALTINKKIQIVKYLQSTSLELDSLPFNISSRIELIRDVSSDGSFRSWNKNEFSTLNFLEPNKTYEIVSVGDIISDYQIYTDTDTNDTSSITTISQQVSYETYRGYSSLDLNTANFKQNIIRIYGITEDGASYISYSPNSLFNTLTKLQPNTGYLFITKGESFTLWNSATDIPTPTVTRTNTPTPTITPTITPTFTLTPTITPSPSPNTTVNPPLVSFNAERGELLLVNFNDMESVLHIQRSDNNGDNWQDILAFYTIQPNVSTIINYNANVSTIFRARSFLRSVGTAISAWSYGHNYSNTRNFTPAVMGYIDPFLHLYNINDSELFILIEKYENNEYWQNLLQEIVSIPANSNYSILLPNMGDYRFRSRFFDNNTGSSVSDWSYSEVPIPTPTPTTTPSSTITPTATQTPTITPTVTPSVTITATATQTPTTTPTVTPSASVFAVLTSDNNWTYSINGNILAKFIPDSPIFSDVEIRITMNSMPLTLDSSIPSVSNIRYDSTYYGQFIYNTAVSGKNMRLVRTQDNYYGTVTSPTIILS